MSLRSKIIIYLIAIHLILATVAVLVLRHNRWWLLPMEALFLCSILIGLKLVKSFFVPLELIRTGTHFINERDFSSRLRKVGQLEMDELIEVYNRMIDHLREERLRVREKHYFLDKIITASPSGIITFDFDDRIDIVNPAAERILQASAQELQGNSLTSLQGSFPQALSRLVTGEARVLNLRGRRRMKCHKSVFLDQGFPRQFLMIEELTEELCQTEKSAYEKMIRLMAHEVNNSIGASNSLLNSCLNYRDQIRDEDRADFESALQIAISRTEHLSAFTKSFADVIRIPPPHMQPCDVLSLLQQIGFLMRAESQRRAITWNWEIDEEIEPVLMDKNQMEQVFVNILKNALEAIGQEGNITVKVGKKRGQQFVLIEDSGSGIPPEVQQNLFTPFFTTKEHGQGMGLTLVQEILSRHHFDFSLESQPGQPTQFAIYF